jgi:hypothetical protein
MPVPDYPDLSVVSHNSERYPPLLLERIAHEVSRMLKHQHPETPLSCAAMKAWLHELHTPLRLSKHSLAAPWQHLPQDQCCKACAIWLRQMIECLETVKDQGNPSMCGQILRLRFLSGLRAKAIMLQLNISERHYHRLQNEGLEWLVEQYRLLGSESRSTWE